MKPIPYHIARHYDSPKMYLSFGDSRRLAVEMPVGDPFGGPASGVRAMPIVAVAMAASSFVAGAAAVAAGTATFMTGLSMVASALTVVGVVTGNNKLAMIGGITSLGANMLDGGGIFGGGEEAAGAGMAPGETGAMDMGAGGSGMEGVGGGLIDAPTSQFTSTLPSDAVGTATDQGMSVANNDTSGVAQGGGEMPAPGQEATQPAAQPFDAGSLSTNSAYTPDMPGVGTDAFNAQAALEAKVPVDELGGANASYGGSTGGLINSAPGGGFIDKAGNWIEKNPTLAKMGLGALQGAIPTNQQKAQTDLTKAQAEAIRQRMAEDKTRQGWRRGLINQ